MTAPSKAPPNGALHAQKVSDTLKKFEEFEQV